MSSEKGQHHSPIIVEEPRLIEGSQQVGHFAHISRYVCIIRTLHPVTTTPAISLTKVEGEKIGIRYAVVVAIAKMEKVPRSSALANKERECVSCKERLKSLGLLSLREDG